MTDLDHNGLRRSECYHTFHAARATRVRIEALERLDGKLTPRDFSDAKWQLRFRAYVAAAATGQTFVLNVAMTKLAGDEDDGDTGRAEVLVTFPHSAVGDVVCEVVAIDTSVVNAETPSGKVEHRIDAPWTAVVRASAGATS